MKERGIPSGVAGSRGLPRRARFFSPRTGGLHARPRHLVRSRSIASTAWDGLRDEGAGGNCRELMPGALGEIRQPVTPPHGASRCSRAQRSEAARSVRSAPSIPIAKERIATGPTERARYQYELAGVF